LSRVEKYEEGIKFCEACGLELEERLTPLIFDIRTGESDVRIEMVCPYWILLAHNKGMAAQMPNHGSRAHSIFLVERTLVPRERIYPEPVAEPQPDEAAVPAEDPAPGPEEFQAQVIKDQALAGELASRDAGDMQ
jgi:hypothetical protein